MGRAKKAARAHKRLSQGPYKAANPFSVPLPDVPVEFEQTSLVVGGIHPDDVDITTETLQHLITNPDLLKSRSLKLLKTAVFEVHRECLNQTTSGTSLTSRISSALTDARWVDALVLLSEMCIRGIVPKLGSVQRWSRECDAASLGQGDGIVWDVLHAILRTTEPTMRTTPVASISRTQNLQMNEPWISRISNPSNEDFWTSQQTGQLCTPEEQNYFRSNFSVLLNTPGPQRRPPNKFPAIIYHSPPALIMSASPSFVTRQDVPGVPSAFLLLDVLSSSECKKLVQAAESIGMLPDEPLGGTSAAELTSVLAHNLIWLADLVFITEMFRRIKTLLPETIAGGRVQGINRRFRLYRYRPGALYRPHIDGAWPASGIADTNPPEYVYDSDPTLYSRLTLLLYLNDTFDGGCTTFFLPSRSERLQANPVKPVQGAALLFPHGSTEGSLLHEGSGVLSNAKYVVRTEVLYEVERDKDGA